MLLSRTPRSGTRSLEVFVATKEHADAAFLRVAVAAADLPPTYDFRPVWEEQQRKRK